jgi:hypothetical protein
LGLKLDVGVQGVDEAVEVLDVERVVEAPDQN